MLIADFFQWWYSTGWALQAHKLQIRIREVSQVFSVQILFRTLFAPWRRIISAPGRGLDAHVQAAIDNAVGRFIGFFVRLIVLFSAGVVTLFVAMLGLVKLLAWPLLPLAIPALIVIGLLR